MGVWTFYIIPLIITILILQITIYFGMLDEKNKRIRICAHVGAFISSFMPIMSPMIAIIIVIGFLIFIIKKWIENDPSEKEVNEEPLIVEHPPEIEHQAMIEETPEEPEIPLNRFEVLDL
jgi:chromate transport protein ChrA